MTGAVMIFFSVSLCVGLGLSALVMAAGNAHAEEPKVVAVPGSPALLLSNFDLGPLGYTTNEFFVSGTASSYKLTGAPTKADPIKLKDGQPGAPANLVLDANGLAEGGIRTPWVDVPTARLSGVGNSDGMAAMMAGVCEPCDAATLDRLYPGGKSEYLKKFEASLALAIKAGFILPADRQEILDLAAISYRGSH
jgi:hypothetical protein